MKSLTVHLLQDFVSSYKNLLIGARLLKVGRCERDLWLFFCKDKIFFYLYFCMDPQSPCPFMFRQKDLPLFFSKREKPVQLFLKTHTVGTKTTHFFVNVDKGRILFLEFQSPSRKSTLEIRLFPHGQNILVQSGGKKISWNKVMEIPLFSPSVQSCRDIQDNQSNQHREKNPLKATSKDFDEMAQAFLKEYNRNKNKNKNGTQNPKAHFELLLSKKRKILKKLFLNLEEKKEKIQRYLQLSQHLNGVLNLKDVDLKWDKDLDHGKSLPWNREKIFSSYKKEKQKYKTILERILIVEEEIKALQKNPDFYLKKENLKQDYLQKRKGKETYLILTDKMMAFMGTSAKKNMELLRRAKPWYLWLHAKDLPGPHVLLACPRGEEVEEKHLLQVAGWLRLAQFKKKLPPVEFCVVIAECRYVRPIKGDRLGRVSYQNSRTLIYRNDA